MITALFEGFPAQEDLLDYPDQYTPPVKIMAAAIQHKLPEKFNFKAADWPEWLEEYRLYRKLSKNHLEDEDTVFWPRLLHGHEKSTEDHEDLQVW